MPLPTVCAVGVSGLLDFASSRGGSRAAIIARAGIDERSLDDPDNRFPLERYVALLRVAKVMTDDPALALHFSEEIGMSKISIVGLVMEAPATMGEAVAQLQRHGRLAADVEEMAEGPRFELCHRGGKLFMVDRRRDANAAPELTEIAFGSLVCGPRRFLPRPHVLAVHVTYPAPAYAAEYRRIFKCPVHFGTDWNAMELHPDIAGWEVAQGSRYVFGVLTKHADALLQDMDVARTMSGRVETLLLATLHEGDPSADSIAGQLGCSRQTLFRKLKDEGTTFTGILEALRERVAKSYLDGRSVSVNEIAYLVGFSDPASFSRAFKRWTGQPPKEFRRQSVDDCMEE